MCTIFPTTFLEIAVYNGCKYELTGCIAGMNVVFPGLDLNIKSYDNNNYADELQDSRMQAWSMPFLIE